jgi:hypothetical protein
MFAQITNKIELTFWDVIISFLSKATWLKWPIGQVMYILKDEHLKTRLALTVVIACVGFAIGILAYTLSLLG